MEKSEAQVTPAKIQIETQISAGGVVIRQQTGALVEMVLVAIGPAGRWQLPKGIIETGETPEQAATREVREETGVEGTLLAPLEVVQYWYVSTRNGSRTRFHKFVHFFLFTYRTGDVTQHDHEVSEARWVTFAEALTLLTFATERQVVERAQAFIEHGHELPTDVVATADA